MLSCSLARPRLAALGDPADTPVDLAGHVDTCAGCAAYARHLVRIDVLIPMLPVPAASPEARRRTLALVNAGPIIVPRPTSPATPSALARLGAFAWQTRESWQYVAGVAAVLAVGLSLYLVGTRPAQEVARPRHDLLASQVRSLARLSKAETAEAKLDVWGDVASELVAEAERVHVGANADDLEALDRMFARAVNDGLVRQARQLPPNLTAPQRRAKLKGALERASQLEVATRSLSERAPVQAVPAMRNLARTATEGKKALAAVARPEA